MTLTYWRTSGHVVHASETGARYLCGLRADGDDTRSRKPGPGELCGGCRRSLVVRARVRAGR